MPTSSQRVTLTDDPAAFLRDAEGHLAADPVVTTVIATVTARIARGGGSDAPYQWWAVARDDSGAVTGVAMRTAPFAPYPVYLLPMPDAAAVALARLLHERGEEVGGVNGALPAAGVFAEETARLSGGAARVHEHMRLFELDELVVPPAPPGRLRVATSDDVGRCLAWFRAFGADAAEQAGRDEPHAMEELSEDQMLTRIADGVVWLWEDASGAVVHLTAANPPAHGVARIGPVYTPKEHRGHGYASRAVAEVSQLLLDRGVRCCLFTDQANPTSNRIYESIGYRPVVDMVNLLVGI
ncbi:GNAT family N-acetyltransferase [Nocardioides sp. MAH-18]|uniref:GNAT family N-acetyltransferase n=1 Tax=Nocardioides agri TaxID=2682843 RepID=A0A6L6XKU1_9ACTN|nr:MULTISPECIES: GNAT family N-acetyltransferase [unclassified Nocardioides]MBA2956686.1 GNAT family N-acetyltransferase [Nocardioides sp. CGMCC 1.13656]MVQ47829.1 GNAT family N-acetyltransferase [Nocardioides sp. MAH-18]